MSLSQDHISEPCMAPVHGSYVSHTSAICEGPHHDMLEPCT